MPLYDFCCRSCGHRFEALVLGSDRPECPRCAGQDLEKLPSTFAVHGATAGGAPTGGSACGGCSGGNCSTCR